MTRAGLLAAALLAIVPASARAAGQPDDTFGDHGRLSIAGLDVGVLGQRADGQLVAAGAAHASGIVEGHYSVNWQALGHRVLSADGGPPSGTRGNLIADSVDPDRAVNSPVQATVSDAAGRTYLAGSEAGDQTSNTSSALVVARYLPGGTLDTSWGHGGIAEVGNGGPAYGFLLDLEVRRDGGVRAITTDAGGNRDSPGIVALTPQGTLDRSFGSNGVAPVAAATAAFSSTAEAYSARTSETTDSDGHVHDALTVSRYGVDGALEDTRTSVLPGETQLVDLAPAADGAMLVIGDTEPHAGVEMDALVGRLRPDGALDPAFGDGGVATLSRSVDVPGQGPQTRSRSVLALADGGLLLGGGDNDPSASSGSFVARFTASGRLDPGFASAGVTDLNLPPQDRAEFPLVALVVQPSGRIVVSDENGEVEALTGSVPPAVDPIAPLGDEPPTPDDPSPPAHEQPVPGGRRPPTLRAEGRLLLR